MNLQIKNNKEIINDLCKSHHVRTLYVIGSAARDKMNSHSDNAIQEFTKDIQDYLEYNQ